jgi:hypothetical protein
VTFIVPANFRQLPPVWEISQPFNINAAAEVAYDDDPVTWARNHILAILLTNPKERVMRPTYGVGIFKFVWENDNPLKEAEIINEIRNAVAQFEPNVTLQAVQFFQAPDFSGIVTLNIEFSVGANPTVHTMMLSLGGTGVEVTALPA